jgi:hypothetical protein
MEMKWLTLPERFFGSTNSEDATSPLQPVWGLCPLWGPKFNRRAHAEMCEHRTEDSSQNCEGYDDNSAGVDLGASALPEPTFSRHAAFSPRFSARRY